MQNLQNLVDEITRRIDIVEFIGARVELKKAGSNYKACCPFHHEKTPSFIVSRERQMWYCFGACHEGGGVIKFLMKYDNLTFTEAVRELARQLGINTDSLSEGDKEYQIKTRLLQIHKQAAQLYSQLLQHEVGKQALAYLKQRQINDKLIETLQLGYAPKNNYLLKHLLKAGYKEDELVASGLIIKSNRGDYYDRFRDRLMFPIYNLQEQIVAFSGRILNLSQQGGKYINSPETAIYHKRETLFGINLAKEAIKTTKTAIVVEGEFDMISPYQHGINNVVAVKGSAVTKEQLTLLKRLAQKVILALDADEAGQNALKRTITAAEQVDIELYVFRPTQGKDPDEAVWADPIAFKKALKAAPNIYDYYLENLKQKYDLKNSYDKKNFAHEMVDMLTRISNPIVLSLYINKLAEILTVSNDAIEKMLHQRKLQSHNRTFSNYQTPVTNAIKREENLERYLLSRIIQQDDGLELARTIFEIIDIEHLSTPAYQKIASFIIKSSNQDQLKNLDKILPAELKPTFNELALYKLEEKASQRDLIKQAYQLKQIILNKRFIELSRLDDEARSPDPTLEEALANMNNELKDIAKKLKMYQVG